jgi:hypothetical protein
LRELHSALDDDCRLLILKSEARVIVSDFLAWVAQTIASSALAIVGFIAIRSTAVGENFLSHRLQRQIEELRNQLANLQDRGRRANELEFDAVSRLWRAYVEAHIKTQQAVLDYQSYPDLKKMTDEDVAAFLKGTELSEGQQKQVVNSTDRNAMFSKITRSRTINIAGAAIYEGRLLLRTVGIFVDENLAQSFKLAFDRLSQAQVEQYMDFTRGRSPSDRASTALLSPDGEAAFTTLQSQVRSTLRRE